MTISSSCVLDGVTLATDFLVDRPAYEFSIYSLTLRNGLTLENGSAVVVGGDYRNRVFAEGDMEISGQGQVQLPGRATSSQSNSWPLIVLKHSELTIGEDVEVILNGGYGIIRPDYENDSGLINNGIISGRGAGEFTLAVTSAMENHGLIQATEGTELSISAQGSSMLNSGTIEALQDSNLYIYGWGQPLLNNGSFHVDASSYIRVYDGFEPTDESLIWIELLSEGASGKLFLDGDCVLAGGLKLRFAEGFDLEVGQTFNVIISSGSISGEFDSVDTSLLPAGLSASVHYGSQAVTVEIVSEPESIPGDYNADGTVDLADYTVWADSYGQTGSDLPADGNEDGVVDLADYTVWADHFGQTTN
jgi:hypothetical protein